MTWGMKARGILLAALAAAVFAAHAQAGPERQAGLLFTGFFHGDEILAITGEEWFGLFEHEGVYTLSPTLINVETVPDPILDEDGRATGKEVTVEHPGTPLFLVSGIDGLMPGPVKGASASGSELHAGASVTMELDGDGLYVLRALGEPIDDWTVEGYALELFREGRSQVIARIKDCCSDSVPRLIWAGDLDRDGGLDMLIDLGWHYNVSAPTLFMSDKGGGMVIKAAELIMTGC